MKEGIAGKALQARPGEAREGIAGKHCKERMEEKSEKTLQGSTASTTGRSQGGHRRKALQRENGRKIKEKEESEEKIMKELKYVIRDAQGIHARPAGMFIKEAAAFPCSITIAKNGKEVDAKRIFGVMGLGVKCGEEIVLKADGEQEDEAIAKLGAFLQENL